MSIFDNWACKLGIHDWIIIERVNENELVRRIERKVYNNFDVMTRITPDVVENKYCSRCKIRMDDVTDFTSEYIKNRKGTLI